MRRMTRFLQVYFAVAFASWVGTPAADASQPEPASVFRDCAECPEMVVVPAGDFLMGTPDTEEGRLKNEGPVRKVRIPKPFAASRFEITVGQYRKFVEDTGHVENDACVVWTGLRGGEPVAGKGWKDPNFEQADNNPVVCISWNDAKLYIQWLAKKTGKAYRFLTEAEWEYAARAGTQTRYSFGNDEQELCKYANVPDRSAKVDTPGSYWKYIDCDDGYGTRTSPAGSYAPNAFGVYDAHGNVWEWVEDCYFESFADAPSDGSARTSGADCTRTVRGGSLSAPVQNSRSGSRYKGETELRGEAAKNAPKEWRNFNLGLRIARTLD